MSYGANDKTAKRIDEMRCTTCNQVIVDAWVCIDCAFDFFVIDEDPQPVTVTKISRQRQRRVDAAAQHEQLIQLQTVTDADVTPAREPGRNAPHHDARASTHSPKTAVCNISAFEEAILSESHRSKQIRKMARDANRVGSFRELMDLQIPDPTSPYNKEVREAARVERVKTRAQAKVEEKKVANVKRTPWEHIERMVREHGAVQVAEWLNEAAKKIEEEEREAARASMAAKLKELEEKIAEGERAKAELEALTAP